jgi:hypothetical protein
MWPFVQRSAHTDSKDRRPAPSFDGSLPPARAATRPYKQRFSKTPISLSSVDFDRRAMYSSPLAPDVISDRGRFLATYFRLLARIVPTVSDAVWVWQTLCSTPRMVKFEGGSEKDHQAAAMLTRELHQRLTPFRYTQNAGLDLLIDLYFRSLFTVGKFSGAIVASENRIERFVMIDPTLVDFDSAFVASVRGALFPVNTSTLYYAALNQEPNNPYGSAMLEAATTLIEIADEMMTDMRYASSNAGIPRQGRRPLRRMCSRSSSRRFWRLSCSFSSLTPSFASRSRSKSTIRLCARQMKWACWQRATGVVAQVLVS